MPFPARALFVLSLCLVCFGNRIAAAQAQAQAQGEFYLKDGDRVLFYGDSITDQRLYTTFVETYVATRFPRLKIRYIHSGWSGDKVTGGYGGPIDIRLQRDVIAYQPTVVTIMLGMNDARYKAFDQGWWDIYTAGYEQIVKTLRQSLPKARFTLLQPSPYDDVTRAPTAVGGYNTVLVRYGEWVKELAQREGLQVADLNTPVVAALTKAVELNPALAIGIIPDRIHPSPGGHALLAAALLRAWNAPATVTAVEIDGAAARIVRAENTKLDGLKTIPGGLTWTQNDAALPLSFEREEPRTALALQAGDVDNLINQQPLKVTGLAAGKYSLKISGVEVGVFSHEELAAGINLALLPTPMLKQAQAVHTWTLHHTAIHQMRWRQVETTSQNDKLPHRQMALDALDALEDDAINQQRTAAQPVPQTYELTAVAI